MSESLEENLKNFSFSNLLHFYTAPSTSPASITNNAEAIASTESVLQDFAKNEQLLKYDGYLIACFSLHPLVNALGKLTGKPTRGIFQSALLSAMESNKKCCILTSTASWERPLDEAILNFLNLDKLPNFLQATTSPDLNPLQLESEDFYYKIENKLLELAKDNIDLVILGCAGYSQILPKLKLSAPNLTFVDGVVVGVELLLNDI